MDNNFMNQLPNDKFTIGDSRTLSSVRFALRERAYKESQNFIKDTLLNTVNGIESYVFDQDTNEICLTMNKVPDKEKLDGTVYYIMNRLYDRYITNVKGIAISQLYSIVYIGNHVYIYL